MKPTKTTSNEGSEPSDVEKADLLPLFRLLLREPPADHDFATCPVCQEFGIKKI